MRADKYISLLYLAQPASNSTHGSTGPLISSLFLFCFFVKLFCFRVTRTTRCSAARGLSSQTARGTRSSGTSFRRCSPSTQTTPASRRAPKLCRFANKPKRFSRQTQHNTIHSEVSISCAAVWSVCLATIAGTVEGQRFWRPNIDHCLAPPTGNLCSQIVSAMDGFDFEMLLVGFHDRGIPCIETTVVCGISSGIKSLELFRGGGGAQDM